MLKKLRFKRSLLVTTVLLTFLNPIDIQNSQINIQNSKIVIAEKAALAKKSGGRNRGGSFKKRSNPSKSPQNNRRSSPDRDRNDYDDRSRSNRNYNTSTSNNPSTPLTGAAAWIVITIGIIILLSPFLVLGYGIFLLVQFLVRFVRNRNNSKAERQRDNDRVTITKLQIAFLSTEPELQKKLSELTANADTETDRGLFQLLQESVLILLRNSQYWSHVLSSSESIHINEAESNFEKISLAERSKFSSETLSNVNGEIKVKDEFVISEDEFSDYVVVTLIIGTADDRPLFDKINTTEELQASLEKIALMREDYLMKFELLWSPQTEKESLTYDELLTEYTDMIKIF